MPVPHREVALGVSQTPLLQRALDETGLGVGVLKSNERRHEGGGGVYMVVRTRQGTLTIGEPPPILWYAAVDLGARRFAMK